MMELLCDILILVGFIEVELMIVISSIDVDFMVKVIDVYFEKFEYFKIVCSYLKSDYLMSGY